MDIRDAMRAELEADVSARAAAQRRLTPRGAPPIPRVTAGAVARAKKNPPAELRDLDAAFRGKFFALFDDATVMARVRALVLSEKDEVSLKALRILLETIPVQRKESDGEVRGGVNITIGEIPRPAKDITPR